MQRQSSYKVHMNTISNGELSDPLCDRVNRGLTLVRLTKNLIICTPLLTYIPNVSTNDLFLVLNSTSSFTINMEHIKVLKHQMN